MDTKKCFDCGEFKHKECFSKDSSRKDGLQPRCKQCKAKYHLLNRNKDSIRQAEYRAKNRDKLLSQKAKYRADNLDKIAASNAMRKSIKLRATPTWVDQKAILDFYIAAKAFELYTGDEYHVDHIVPLNSDKVCGIHCENNLQILSAKDNMTKGNRYWPDMW